MSSSKMFCEKKGRNRMAFQTRERANFFIEHFDDMIEGEVELRPCRSFYCPSCDRWHITHFPISPDNERFEERNQKIHFLQALVQRLKTEYRMNHWEAWKPIVEEAMETMEEFRLRPGFEKLVENTGASLENYLKLIQTAQAKADDSANADFVQMKKEIEQKAKSLNYENFMQEGNKLIEYFNRESLFLALSAVNREWIGHFKVCMAMDSVLEDLNIVMEMANDSVADSREAEAEELYEHVLTLTLALDRLLVAGLPRSIWDVLQGKVKKIANVLEHSFGGVKVDGYESLSEKVRVRSIHKLMEESVRLIENGEKQQVLHVLDIIEKRMTKVPLSLVKISLMEPFCVLGKMVL